MKIRVQYTAQLRSVLGRAEEVVELVEQSSLLDLLRQVGASLPESAGRHLLTSSGEMRPSLLVAVNGEAVSVRGAGSRTLATGDLVVLMPPIAGG